MVKNGIETQEHDNATTTKIIWHFSAMTILHWNEVVNCPRPPNHSLLSCLEQGLPIWRAIIQCLLGGGKRKSITLSDSVPPTSIDSADQSPVSSITNMTGEHMSSSSSSSLLEIPSTLSKQYKSWLTSEQKQKSRVSDLAAKEKSKTAHKDATMLVYHQERSNDGLDGQEFRRNTKVLVQAHPQSTIMLSTFSVLVYCPWKKVTAETFHW